ncbi:MAG: protease complex subunit PrcB family protein [Elusimicrobia bacterium]|nr:protease complex subunit PrcB family protein [Elusimicrobiota bacterium]
MDQPRNGKGLTALWNDPAYRRAGIGLVSALAGLALMLAAGRLLRPAASPPAPAAQRSDADPSGAPLGGTRQTLPLEDGSSVPAGVKPEGTAKPAPAGPGLGGPEPQPSGGRQDLPYYGSYASEPVSSPEAAPGMSMNARRAYMAEYIRQLELIRESMEARSRRAVPISGRTAKLLASPPKESAPLADGPAQVAWRGQYGGANEDGTMTIMSAEEWRKAWTRLSQEPIPGVDFKRYEVVAVFLGHQPTAGYDVEVVDVGPTETSIVVRYRVVEPAAGVSAPQTPTSPYAMQIIPRSDLPVRFVRETKGK